MTKLEYLIKQHESILGWYKQSEEKAKFLVSLNTFVVGVVNGLVFIGADKIEAVRSFYTFPVWLLLMLSGIALVGSYLFIFRAMWPRHHAIDKTLKNNERIWFFGDIASMTRDNHEKTMSEWTERDAESSLIVSGHILSKNVWAKHEALNWAVALTIGSIVLFFALGIAYARAVANI